MNQKTFEYISEVFDNTIELVKNDPKQWTKFLRCASWNYNRRFDEQLLLYAQNPNATAIAQAKTWSDPNRPYGRWVNSKEKGIPLFQNFNPQTQEKQGVLYYFDVSQTHETKSTKRHFYHWQAKEEYEGDIIDVLEDTFGSLENAETFADAVISSAKNATRDYFEELEFANANESTFEETQKEKLSELMQNSIAYIMLSRLGLNADEHLSLNDFGNLQYFRTNQDVYIIGNAVRDNAKKGLKALSKKVLELDTQAKRRSTENEYKENGRDNGRNGRVRTAEGENTVQTGRGLFSTRLENSTTARRGAGQIRRTESEVVGEKETVGLHGISRDFYDGGEAVRERTESVGTRGKTYQGISTERGIDGRVEEQQSYGVGETDEQHQEQSRGNSAERSSLHRLSENKK